MAAKEPTLSEDAQTWYNIRSIYRYDQKVAFDTAALLPVEADAGGSSDCTPVVSARRCSAANAAFIPLPDNSPEYQPGAWPLADTLYPAIAAAQAGDDAVSSIIPLQLQANVLEGYRKVLLHKKWRRCHHLAAMAKNLQPEVRAEDELQQLLLGQQVGNPSET